MTRGTADSDVFHAIADPTRRRLLELLAERERAVTELVDAFAISQPSISQHLRVLRDVGLVETRQSGRHRLYRLQAGKLKEVSDWLTLFERFWEAKLDRLLDYLDRSQREPPP
jgi:DNA-binding transcriptional ArsR family regulator